MNKSKMSATALATVMSATAAHAAPVDITGFASGYWTTSNAATGSALGASSETLMVTYSGTMDNGMGLGMTMHTFGAATNATRVALNVSSEMGDLQFGSNGNSAADSYDGMPAKAGLGLSGTDVVVGKDYLDGDAETGHGLQYTSPSMNGWTAKVSTGFSSVQGVRGTTSLAVKGNIAGVSLAAGIASIGAADTAAVAASAAQNGYYTINSAPGTPILINSGTGVIGDVNSQQAAEALVADGTHTIGQAHIDAVEAVAAVEGDRDDTFMTAAYTLGDITIGYGMYSADNVGGDTATSIGVTMPLAGMTAGIQYGEADNSGANADDDGYRLGLTKSMGAGATFSVEYTDVTTGSTTDENPTSFRVGYSISF